MNQNSEQTYSIYVSPAWKIVSVKNGWSWLAMFVGLVVGEYTTILISMIGKPPQNLTYIDLGFLVLFGACANEWKKKILVKRGYQLKTKLKAHSRKDAVLKYAETKAGIETEGLPPPLPQIEQTRHKQICNQAGDSKTMAAIHGNESVKQEEFQKSWLRRLCVALFWLISIPSVIFACLVTGLLMKHPNSINSPRDVVEIVAWIGGFGLMPLILWSFYRLALWIAFGSDKKLAG